MHAHSPCEALINSIFNPLQSALGILGKGSNHMISENKYFQEKNFSNNDKITPLHNAAENGNITVR